MGAVVEPLLSLPSWALGAAAVAASLGLIYGMRAYQRCPHCGRIVRRVFRGWKRCHGCGRQYRRGLRLR